MTIERRHVGKRLSDLVIYAPPPGGRLVFLAGQVADDAKAGHHRADAIGARADRPPARAKPAATSRSILSATIYLPDMGDFAAMNAVWEAWVPPGETPGARDGRGEARRIRVQGRDPGRRRGRLMHLRRDEPLPAPNTRDRAPPTRRRAATSVAPRAPRRPMPVTRAMFDQLMVPCYAPALVHSGARRRLARLGPGRADVHRLRERRRGDRARPLPSGDGPRARRSRRARSGTCRTGSPTSRRCGSRSSSSTRRSPSACSSATPAPRRTRRR